MEELIDYYLSKKWYFSEASGSDHLIDFVLWRYGEEALFMDDVVMDKGYASRLFENAWKYCVNRHFEQLEWAKNANENTFKFIKSEDFSNNYHWLEKFIISGLGMFQHAAHRCKMASVDELVDYLSKKYDCSPHVVDFVL